MAASRVVAVDWQKRGMLFATDVAGRQPVPLDGDSKEGPSPVEALLLSLGSCTASDVVSILEKKRLTLESLRVEVSGERRDEYPRRYTKIALTYHVRAAGATETAVRQAIDLSLEKYCSVSATLNPDIPITYELVLQA